VTYWVSFVNFSNEIIRAITFHPVDITVPTDRPIRLVAL
jgi:hypothetical protein